jgi:phospholipid/cholesterol/gamma-HCH transport system substrate-binding protein
LLNDKNQKAFSGILANVDTLSGELARSGPELRATISETRSTIKQAGGAIDQIGKLANSTTALVDNEGKPLMSELRASAQQAQKSLANLDAAIGDARPGLQALSSQTIPEVGQLVRDLRVMSESLGSVATKLDQGGAGALLGAPALPDYKPGRKDK